MIYQVKISCDDESEFTLEEGVDADSPTDAFTKGKAKFKAEVDNKGFGWGGARYLAVKNGEEVSEFEFRTGKVREADPTEETIQVRIVDQWEDVHIFPREQLDDEHQKNFDSPWLVQFADGQIDGYATEDEACAFQRQWRSSNGRDPMTGEPA